MTKQSAEFWKRECERMRSLNSDYKSANDALARAVKARGVQIDNLIAENKTLSGRIDPFYFHDNNGQKGPAYP